MNFISIPTEQTTALTDFLMGLVVVAVFIFVNRLRVGTRSPKAVIWQVAFGFLGIASFIGSAAHGFEMAKEVNFALWQPINLALGLVIALFVVATVYDIWGAPVYRRVLVPMIGVALVFYALTLIIRGTFLTFVAYEAVAMLFALGGYLYLATARKMKGAWWMVAGIVITIAAAVIQAVGGENGVVLFLGLDHNGAFHFIQMFGVLSLAVGLQQSLALKGQVPARQGIPG